MKRRSLSLITLLVLSGILISYICQMSPAPFLTQIGADYGIGRDSTLNLAVSIIYPTLIIASLLGGKLIDKIGLHKSFIWVLCLLSVGILLNLIAHSYTLFLLGRAIFGAGFGLGIPFIGSAIMELYNEKQRETLNSINALFPFFGTLLSFALLNSMANSFSLGWKGALGIWGIGTVLILVLWLLLVRSSHCRSAEAPVVAPTESAPNKAIYRDLLKRRAIVLLCIVFMADFFCYSYIVTILPTFLMEQCSFSDAAASLIAALIFPGVGCIGCLLSGVLTARSGKRKPALVFGTVLEVLGIFISTLLCHLSPLFVYVGIALFAFGNGYWLPMLYKMITDLPDMTPHHVANAFALTSVCAFVAGFISPSIGGWLTDLISSAAGELSPTLAHASGLRWSLCIFGIVMAIGVIAALFVKETSRLSTKAKGENKL